MLTVAFFHAGDQSQPRSHGDEKELIKHHSATKGRMGEEFCIPTGEGNEVESVGRVS